jgi:hypothetical protein
MTKVQRPQDHRAPWRRIAVHVGIAAIALAAIVALGEPTDAAAKPSGGTTVSVTPVLKPVTVTQTTPALSPPTPFATPVVRAPQAGAA